MTGQNVGYRRVSSSDQNLENQLVGEKLDKIFDDKISGSTRERPGLNKCLQYLRQGDVLHIHSIDRLARNLIELQHLVQELIDKGITVRFHKENLFFEVNSDGQNPMNRLLFQVMGAFAEFERALIRERQAEGIAKAKSLGKQLGRKHKLNKKEIIDIIKKFNEGNTIKEIAKIHNVSRQTIYSAIKKYKSKLIT